MIVTRDVKDVKVVDLRNPARRQHCMFVPLWFCLRCSRTPPCLALPCSSSIIPILSYSGESGLIVARCLVTSKPFRPIQNRLLSKKEYVFSLVPTWSEGLSFPLPSVLTLCWWLTYYLSTTRNCSSQSSFLDIFLYHDGRRIEHSFLQNPFWLWTIKLSAIEVK